MNQTTTTTTTTTTHPSNVEALRLQLEEDGKNYRVNRKEAHDRLLQTLQTNDCREIMTAIVDGDDLASVFVSAGERGHVDVLEAFLDHGININIKNKSATTALIHACFNEREECARLLLDRNANVDVQDKYGYTALMRASALNNTKVVEILLEKHTNSDIQDMNGMTAFMFASLCGNKDIVQLLLNHGAGIDLRNNGGKTALDLAEDEEIKDLIRNHVNTTYVLK